MNDMESNSRSTGMWELILIAAMTFLLFLVLMRLVPLIPGRGDRVMPVTDGWYCMEDGERRELVLPVTVPVDGRDTFTLYNDSLTAADAGKTVTTRGARYDLTVSVGDQTLYHYDDLYFPRNIQMKSKQSCDAILPVSYAGEVLSFTYRTEGEERITISPVCIGSGGAVMLKHFVEEAVTLCIALLFFILSVISFGVGYYTYRSSIYDRRFVDVAFFLIVCSIWFITDSSIVQQQTGYAPVVCVISFYAFMLMAVPMLHFVQGTGNMGKYRVLDLLNLAFYLNAAGQSILHLWLGIDYVDMLFATHMIQAVGVSVTAVLMVKEYRQDRTREFFVVLSAFGVVGASGVLALVLYWLLEIPWYGSIFQFGILLFVIMILAIIVINMVENKDIRYRMEMQAYQRMAREDWMTGLENRKPFEEFLATIQKDEDICRNAALVFLDLNGLKATNDRYGHEAGDEIIVAAAKCITDAFGQIGKCYRIGGDEFSVIILDPVEGEEAWFARLDKEISRYNKNSRFKLSIARGVSFLYREDGSRRSVSDWKFEADHQMYENKGDLRRL